MPKKEKVKKSSIDRISSMPNEILCHILSFLPTKYAVGTSILSTRWKNLFASVPNLDLDDTQLLDPKKLCTIDDTECRPTFTNFVYRVLLIRNISCITTFRLKCEGEYDNAHINAWICSAIWRSVEKLDVQLNWYTITLPHQLFRCDTLVVLKLGRIFSLDVPSCVWFPRLKILDLDGIVLKGDDAVKRLLAGCPVTENLVMRDCGLCDVQVLDISVTTLKSLTLHNVFDEDHIGSFKIVVNAPLLEYFKHIGNVVSGYSVTNLDSLVEAHIDVTMTEQHIDAEILHYDQSVADLVAAISNVKVLYLSAKTMQAFEYSNCRIPTFPNLTHLELGADHNTGWNLLPELLKSSYNLEKLAFVEGFLGQKVVFRDTLAYCLPKRVPDCMLFHLKDIEIRVFTGGEGELKLVEYFLKSARVLKKMTIQSFYSLSEKQQLCVSQKLLTFPRHSKACQIVFKMGQKKRF